MTPVNVTTAPVGVLRVTKLPVRAAVPVKTSGLPLDANVTLLLARVRLLTRLRPLVRLVCSEPLLRIRALAAVVLIAAELLMVKLVPPSRAVEPVMALGVFRVTEPPPEYVRLVALNAGNAAGV